MKIGLIPVNVGIASVDAMITLARQAEEIGIESLWTFEHVIVPVDYQSKYPYSNDGKMGVTPETPFVDPLIALTVIAAHTERVRLGTGVNILPQCNPLLLAKQAASLDLVSGGRLELGLGIGWLKEEFEAMGVPFAGRGARFDDYVQAMKKVWSGEVVEHESEHLHWSGFKSYPLPPQRPGVRVVIGGSKGKAFERVAKFGDGWYAPTARADQLEPLMASLREALEREGREPATVEVSAMWVPAMEGVDSVGRYADMGVDRLIVPLQALGGGAQVRENLARFGDEVVAKVS